MAHQKNIRNKLAKNQPLLFLLFGSFILIGMIGGFYAKYTYQKSENKDPIAEEFYFTSDFLEENEQNYTLASNTKQLTFELRNYADELRSSASDIKYTYDVKKDNTEVKTGTGTISVIENTGNKESITIDNLSAGTYKIRAIATSPFVKTLKATFTIPDENDDITYKINDSDQSPYVLLEVSTNAYDGKIMVQWADRLIPDSTQEPFKNVENYDSTYKAGNIEMTVQKHSSYTYRFFKEDRSKNYSTTSDIIVKKVTE